ncbi:mitochondrial NADH kinase [Xylariaceae sp. FL0016]|nr:mitochondrial NADH kinase [Xylariaceae sp. FL0016]
MTKPPSLQQVTRAFSATARRLEILDASTLPERILPKYKDKDTPTSSLLSLHWPRPPRNILIIPKLLAPKVTQSAVTFAKYIHAEYPGLNLVFESRVAPEIHEELNFPIYTSDRSSFSEKIDMVATLGGDGTILRAASIFSQHASVPPILSFSMGTLGFLGEWKFEEFKRAWREVYMSGSRVAVADLQTPHTQSAVGSARQTEPGPNNDEGWVSPGGKSMGPSRASKVLLRHRLKAGVYSSDGANVNSQLMPTSTAEPQLTYMLPDLPPARRPAKSHTRGVTTPEFHAINELVIHRGPNPHLAIIDVYIDNHFLTEAVADGILVSTPTGSTAYSLSAGGPIVHPLVKSLLLTPISARSLSFRSLVLPLTSTVVLKLSEKNRGRELEVSIDGKRRAGVTIGMEIRVTGETVGRTPDGSWGGGVPCVIRSPQGDTPEEDDGWVGGLNGLLKFNYPFGE